MGLPVFAIPISPLKHNGYFCDWQTLRRGAQVRLIRSDLASSLITAGMFSSIAFSPLPLGNANAQDTGKKVILSPNAPNPIGPYSP
jgi:hypothetical protein